MKPATQRIVRVLAIAAVLVGLAAGVFAAWLYHGMRQSLPQLDGAATLRGLSAPVSVERDSLGAVTLHAGNRLDGARALGFVHAQDRFFEMDLARRYAAGELAELFGKSSLPQDRRTRLFRFRRVAEQALAGLPDAQRALLEAYTAGVNAGLAGLASKPFEYMLLRTPPAPWKPEDCLLVLYAEAIDLESRNIAFERSLSVLHDTFGNAAVAYFAPPAAPGDAALDGSSAPLAPMPSDHLIDIRKRVYEYEDARKHASLGQFPLGNVLPGSNAFALAGDRSATGAAVLANDLHRALTVPNLYYRASLEYPGANGRPVRVTGVTLPGFPLFVAGSNGRVAWGVANACADTADLVILNSASVPGTYMEGDTPKLYGKETETLRVRGAPAETMDCSWTAWGPVVGTNADKHDLALKWTMLDPKAVNLDFIDLETASTVDDAVAIAHRTGMPVQNLIAADTRGAIAWTVCGKLPQRFGYDGRLSATWAFGDRKWIGYVPPTDIPAEVSPAGGILWSANQRMLGGPALEVLGDGGYAPAARAARIRDDVAGLRKATARDLLGVELDVRAPSLDRWQQLLLAVLTPDAVAKNRDRAALRASASPWEGEASVSSVSYRLVASFRDHVAQRVLPVIFEPCYDAYDQFDYSTFDWEPSLWDMVEKRPPHLLGQDYGSWDDLFLAAADDVIAEVKKEQGSVKAAAWGDHNRADIRHPLAKWFPGPLGAWLRMPSDPLAGDKDTPRVQTPRFGAAVRFAVSPGHEADGVIEMPAGQSGNPLSPFYRSDEAAWVKGEPVPFLPGPAVHTLTLSP